MSEKREQKKILKAEEKRLLEELRNKQPGSEEYNELLRQYSQTKEMEESTWRRILDFAGKVAAPLLAVGYGIVSVAVHHHELKQTFEFEETGTIRSIAGKNVVNSSKTSNGLPKL